VVYRVSGNENPYVILYNHGNANLLLLGWREDSMEFDFNVFYSSIQEDFSYVQKKISSLEESAFAAHRSREDDELDELNMKYTLERIKIKLSFAIEILGLQNLLQEFLSGFKKYESKLTDLELISYIGVLYSPALDYLGNYKSAITSHIKIEEKDITNSISIRLLEQILKGTPKLLADSKIVPSCEADVRAEIYKILIHVFPDTVREVPIAKLCKIFKPDIGIKSLKCAIEYKYVTSEEEAKKSIGGIYEDIQGYKGSEDWKTFYAVIYMTDNFYTQAQVEAEFKLSKVKHNWKPILVYGKGDRVKLLKKYNKKKAKKK